MRESEKFYKYQGFKLLGIQVQLLRKIEPPKSTTYMNL